jgi:hypothetical protein
MMNKNTNSKPNASNTNRYNVRGANGRFISTMNSTVVKNGPLRDSKGRFKSLTSVKNVAVKSSFIKNMTVSGNLVNVVMTRSPKTTYTYKPTQSGMAKVKSAIKSNVSLGTVYNNELRGREVSRTIYR